MKSLVTEVKLTTALNGFPEAAGLGVVPVAAHPPHDDEESWHDEGEGGREGKMLDLDLAGKLGELVGDERAEHLSCYSVVS